MDIEKPKSPRVIVNLTPEQRLGIEKLKERYGISINQAVRFAVAYLLEHTTKIKKAYPFMDRTERRHD